MVNVINVKNTIIQVHKEKTISNKWILFFSLAVVALLSIVASHSCAKASTAANDKRFTVLQIVPIVQECDATGDAQRTFARPIKTIT